MLGSGVCRKGKRERKKRARDSEIQRESEWKREIKREIKARVV
jgi:hypothetical protein